MDHHCAPPWAKCTQIYEVTCQGVICTCQNLFSSLTWLKESLFRVSSMYLQKVITSQDYQTQLWSRPMIAHVQLCDLSVPFPEVQNRKGTESGLVSLSMISIQCWFLLIVSWLSVSELIKWHLRPRCISLFHGKCTTQKCSMGSVPTQKYSIGSVPTQKYSMGCVPTQKYSMGSVLTNSKVHYQHWNHIVAAHQEVEEEEKVCGA